MKWTLELSQTEIETSLDTFKNKFDQLRRTLNHWPNPKHSKWSKWIAVMEGLTEKRGSRSTNCAQSKINSK